MNEEFLEVPCYISDGDAVFSFPVKEKSYQSAMVWLNIVSTSSSTIS